jgi:hypothetical protein
MVARCTFVYPKMDFLPLTFVMENLSRLLMETLKAGPDA